MTPDRVAEAQIALGGDPLVVDRGLVHVLINGYAEHHEGCPFTTKGRVPRGSFYRGLRAFFGDRPLDEPCTCGLQRLKRLLWDVEEAQPSRWYSS